MISSRQAADALSAVALLVFSLPPELRPSLVLPPAAPPLIALPPAGLSPVVQLSAMSLVLVNLPLPLVRPLLVTSLPIVML